ncbi:Integrase-like protein [Rubellimicrobium mesophilum DSM 19309]|uniref:Integrase-like protein n=1 Tax=Rubellimicrobium mesophilum DSM 19309 TaxID=442562 RepID=A0A017HKF1_9RHOB|nr:tyrosine-type recombinase/integrase [Rubellimicrobium mesophilum]EYD74254.1 Integrase-like protein [Rubellimicrobium mesophilum DSM 19309]
MTDALTLAQAAALPTPELAERIAQAVHDPAGADASNTVKTYAAALRDVARWAAEAAVPSLPMAARDLARYVDDRAAAGRAPATVSLYVTAVGRAHRDVGLPSPADDRVVKLALRRMRRQAAEGGHRQRQAVPMRVEHIDAALAGLGDSLGDLRDAALVTLAFDTLLRSAELVALRAGDVQPQGRDAIVRVGKTKTDQDASRGDVRFVSRATYARVARWIAAAGLAPDAPLFPSLSRRGQGDRMAPRDVARVFDRRMPGHGFTGHSSRVGAAVSQREAGIPTGLIAQAGAWASDAMVSRYTRAIDAQESGAAILARRQGRS